MIDMRANNTDPSSITELLTALGLPRTAARRCGEQVLFEYLTRNGSVSPDDLADCTAEQRGLAMELACTFAEIGRHAYNGVGCPDIGTAADYAALAVRQALYGAERAGERASRC